MKYRDIPYGKIRELEVMEELKETFEDVKQLSEYSTYDFLINNSFYGELKSRRCYYNSYPTTFINCEKINKMIDNENYLFLFLFYDGLYYLFTNRKKINQYLKNGEVKWSKCYRKDRKTTIKNLEININLLKKFN
jgi:hypothetical protein